MDKSWMHVDRRSVAYKLGVENFFKFALENAKDPNKISCPCIKCGNMDDFPISVIKTHLYYNGVDESYKFWKWHGEVADTSSVDSTSSDSSDPIESESVEGNVRVDCNVEMDGFNDDDEEFSSECNEFREFVDDANKPLYPGCEGFTKLSVLVKLYNLKAKHGMSDAAYSDWLIKGCQTKQGTFKDVRVKETAEKIETLRQKERKGDLTISGTTDVLTLALGTPEHAGRVRGVGGFVQPNQYFHLPKRRKESVHETVRLSVKQILEEEREKMETEIREKVLAEEKEKIAADERAHWVSRLEQLEAKINGLGNTEPVVIEHVSGEASCSKTHEPCMGAEQGLKVAKKQNNHVEAGAMTKVFEEMEKKLVQKQRKKTSKGMKDKIAKPTTLGVDDEAKVLDKELYVDAVKNDAEEIESVDLNLIEKQNKGIPAQPSDKECGYYVMRYMKDIIEDTDLSFAEKWGRRGSHVPVYGQEDIDEVRNELATYVVTNHLKL